MSSENSKKVRNATIDKQFTSTFFQSVSCPLTVMRVSVTLLLTMLYYLTLWRTIKKANRGSDVHNYDYSS